MKNEDFLVMQIQNLLDSLNSTSQLIFGATFLLIALMIKQKGINFIGVKLSKSSAYFFIILFVMLLYLHYGRTVNTIANILSNQRESNIKVIIIQEIENHNAFLNPFYKSNGFYQNNLSIYSALVNYNPNQILEQIHKRIDAQFGWFSRFIFFALLMINYIITLIFPLKTNPVKGIRIIPIILKFKSQPLIRLIYAFINPFIIACFTFAIIIVYMLVISIHKLDGLLNHFEESIGPTLSFLVVISIWLPFIIFFLLILVLLFQVFLLLISIAIRVTLPIIVKVSDYIYRKL